MCKPCVAYKKCIVRALSLENQKEILGIGVYFSPHLKCNESNLEYTLDFKNRTDRIYESGKISANGQITVPVEIRRLLGLKSGDKILFFQKQDGEIFVSNVCAQAILRAQTAFADAADALGISDEIYVQALVGEVRYEKTNRKRAGSCTSFRPQAVFYGLFSKALSLITLVRIVASWCASDRPAPTATKSHPHRIASATVL